MFTRLTPHFFENENGESLDYAWSMRQVWITYRKDGRAASVEGETGPGMAVGIFAISIRSWLEPHASNPFEDSDRARILECVEETLGAMGIQMLTEKD